MIIHCIDRLEAEHLLQALIQRGRRLSEVEDDEEESSVVVCECEPGCELVYRRYSKLGDREYTTDEIRDLVAARGESSSPEDGDEVDLSFMPGTQTISEHEDGDVSVFQGELWDTGTGYVGTLNTDENNQQYFSESRGITIEDLERLRDVLAVQPGRFFVSSSDGRREDSSTSQGLRGEAPRMGNQARHWLWPEGREQD